MTAKTINHTPIKLPWKPIEIFTVFLGTFLLLSSLIIYYSDASLKYYLFGTGEDELISSPIGSVTVLTGEIERKRFRDSSFQIIQKDELVYPGDSIMTGSNSATTLELDHGQKIEIPAKSMVRLEFMPKLSLGSFIPKRFFGKQPNPHISIVSRAGRPPLITPIKPKTLEIIETQKEVIADVSTEKPTIKVAEKVSEIPAQAPALNAPTSATPLKIKVNSPALDLKTQFTLSEALAGEKNISFNFELNQKESGLSFQLSSTADKGTENSTAKDSLDASQTSFTLSHPVTKPGDYIWKVLRSSGESIATGKIKVLSKITSSSSTPSLKTSVEVPKASKKMTSENFPGFVLNWESAVTASTGDFKIAITDSFTKKALFQTTSNKPPLVYSANKVVFKKMVLTIEQPLKNGFILVSNEVPFQFLILPPLLKSPVEGSTSSSQDIYLVWASTGLTSQYLVEVSKNQDFKKI